MEINKNTPVYMIGIDGGLRTIPAHHADELTKQGWKLVQNPKRTYYQEYDQTHPAYKEKELHEVSDDSDLIEEEFV